VLVEVVVAVQLVLLVLVEAAEAVLVLVAEQALPVLLILAGAVAAQEQQPGLREVLGL
jgi:hypothetical protein